MMSFSANQRLCLTSTHGDVSPLYQRVPQQQREDEAVSLQQRGTISVDPHTPYNCLINTNPALM